jgi:predicted acylesterase/phospholipase RssA
MKAHVTWLARSPRKNLTFADLWQFNQDYKLQLPLLLVCGANLSYGRSVLFSLRHTPNFPIADAVRISMSLPIIISRTSCPRTSGLSALRHIRRWWAVEQFAIS